MFLQVYNHFNSHAHVERDEIKFGNITAIYISTHAHVERDSVIEITSIIFINFNSHAHVERDAENIIL